MLRDRSHVAFVVTLLVTVAVSLLPADWRLGWSREIADKVLFPLRPFSDTVNRLTRTLRRPRSTAEDVPVEARGMFEQLIEDRDVAERLYQAEHRRVLALEEEIRHLKHLPAETLRAASRIVTAYVIRRTPGSPQGAVEVRLERGAPPEVPEGTIAVSGGVHLLGRTVGPSRRGTCSILPIGNRATGPVRARAFPADRPRATMEESVEVFLDPDGAGAFEGEVDRTVTLEKGDVVRLLHDAWPATAQMMVLGTIASVEVNEREPLRNTIRVEPLHGVSDLAFVMLVVEGQASGAESAGGGP